MQISQAITTACLLEVVAPKPGNVHRGADFEDLTFADFALSAVAIGPVIESQIDAPLGSLIRQAIEATRQVVNTNTNLGICLLLVPLAKSIHGGKISQPNVVETLSQLTAEDSQEVYQAIRLANSSALGKQSQHDVLGEAPADLIAAMKIAEQRDLIARQYCNGFADLFEVVVPALRQHLAEHDELSVAIVLTHLLVMSKYPDSLIARKCGQEIADQAALMADQAYEFCLRHPQNREVVIGDFDFWLRSDGHRRNPGTTADMICAAIFVCLINGDIRFPR